MIGTRQSDRGGRSRRRRARSRRTRSSPAQASLSRAIGSRLPVSSDWRDAQRSASAAQAVSGTPGSTRRSRQQLLARGFELGAGRPRRKAGSRPRARFLGESAADAAPRGRSAGRSCRPRPSGRAGRSADWRRCERAEEGADGDAAAVASGEGAVDIPQDDCAGELSLRGRSVERPEISSGEWIRTTDLRVMSPTSYHCSTPRR